MQPQSRFKRIEKKYRLTPSQYEALQPLLLPYLQADEFACSQINNLYYDTPDHRLIRTSLEKPVYKEKLRLRCYSTPGEETPAFAEVKKKFKGVVYKRRLVLPYGEALGWLSGEQREFPCEDRQVAREIEYFLRFYGSLSPAMALFYDRLSYKGREDPRLRITFDDNIRWRTTELDLTKGRHGTPLFAEKEILMEIKVPGAFPLWLSAMLNACGIYPVSCSKYGIAYRAWKSGGEADYKGGNNDV